MVVDDEYLQMELDALIWRKSQFAANADWVPKDVVSDTVKRGLEERRGKFLGERFTYYLSKSGTITRYWNPNGPESTGYSREDWERLRSSPEPDKKVETGTRSGPSICPECGEPLDGKHRGQHHHS